MIKRIIVLGVSGSGKSFIGEKLAKALGYSFFDGDDFHSEHNIAKMQQGKPLTDDDRQGWLETLNQLLIDNQTAVVACSALKPEYRTLLAKGLNDVALVYLKGDIETIWQRHQQREGHFFNGRAMLESQFETLVEPTTKEAIHIDIRNDVDTILEQTLLALDQ